MNNNGAVNIKFNVLTLLMLVLLSSCANMPEKLMFSMPMSDISNVNRVWPQLPQTPRFLYIGDLLGESNQVKDSSINRSMLSRFFAVLVGLDYQQDAKIDLLRPQQGVVDSDGRIYVVDRGRQAVFVFDEKKGKFFIWNEAELDLPFKSPVGIAIVEKLIMVTDSEQGKIFVLNKQGQLVKIIGGENLQRPTGIAYDRKGERLFVSDTLADNIKVYDLDGKLLNVIGNRGAAAGEFNRPTFISYRDNKLYVVDSLNARIQIFNQSAKHIKTIGERGLYVGNFSRPKGIAVDSEGNIYVTESYYDYLLIFNPSGELLMSIGGSGSQPGKFSQPTAVWVDNNDRVFVSDMLNARVSIFQYLGGN